MKLTLTTLSENTASVPGCLAEWGWSMSIRTDNRSILFDTGAGVAAVRNAETFDIDLKSVDTVVLSHSHSDHTGGAREILGRAARPKLVAHPALWIPKYKKSVTQNRIDYKGIPFAKEEIEKSAVLHLSKTPVQIAENIWTTGEIPRKTDFESIEDHFLVKENETFHPDDFPDDLALVCKTPEGLVIVLGCAHRGIINTIRHAQEITGEPTIRMIIGGTHLYPKKDAQVRKALQALRAMDIRRIGVSHCTGMKAAMQLADAFGDRFFFNHAGGVISIE